MSAPKPFTARALAARPLTAEQWRLVVSHLAVARIVAAIRIRRMGRHAWAFEFHDAALDGLIDAARHHGESPGRFRKLAWSYATRRVVDLIRRRCAAKRGFGRTDRLRDEVIVFDPDPERPPSFEEMVSTLGPPERELLRLRFVAGVPCREIGERTGVDQRTVQRRIRGTLDRLAAEGGGP